MSYAEWSRSHNLSDISFAFQPIVSSSSGRIWAREALMRPLGGLSPEKRIEEVPPCARYRFDAQLRSLALDLASVHDILDVPVSLNVLPGALADQATCIGATLSAAHARGIPGGRLIFEVTEHEPVNDTARLKAVANMCRAQGVRLAIDDFGTGYSGLSLLGATHPDIVKISMELISGIDTDPLQRAIVRSIVSLCAETRILVVAEGVETEGEAVTLQEMGVDLLQGFYFGVPEVPASRPVALAS